MSKLKTNLQTHGGLLLIVLLALAVRLNNLLALPLDWDEANVVAISQMKIPEAIRYALFQDFHPPGLHLTVKAWMALFGSTDASVRMFSVTWSVLAVAGAYWLALVLSSSKHRAVAIASITALLVALMPLAVRYAQMVTNASIYFTLVLFSWGCLLQLIRSESRVNQPAPEPSENIQTSPGPQDKPKFCLARNPWFWGYSLITLWATMLFASGPYFLLFQGLYFLIVRAQLPRQKQIQLFWTGFVLVLLNLPHKILLMQPWNTAQDQAIHQLHPLANFQFLISAPLNLLVYNYDLRASDLALAPPWPQMLPYLLPLYCLLGWSFWQLWKTSRETAWVLLCLGVFPLVGAYLATFFGLALYNYRAMLYTGFTFCFLAAHGIGSLAALGNKADSKENKNLRSENTSNADTNSKYTDNKSIGKHKILAVGTLLAIISCQLALPYPISAFPIIDSRAYARQLKALVRPGDGVMIYPGANALTILRYFRPELFGFTPLEQQQMPWDHYNVFRRVDRIDHDLFLVTGNDILDRHDIKKAFLVFQAQHARMIYVLLGPPLPIVPLMDCTKPMWLVTPKSAHPLHCPGSGS